MGVPVKPKCDSLKCGDGAMHLAELRAMTLIENKDMLVVDIVFPIFLMKHQLLNGRDDDLVVSAPTVVPVSTAFARPPSRYCHWPRLFQSGRTPSWSGSPDLPVNHEDDLVNTRISVANTAVLNDVGLARPCRMPDIIPASMVPVCL